MNTIAQEQNIKRRLSLAGIIWYSLANLAFGSFYAFNNYLLPLWLGDFTKNAIILGLLAGTHSFEGVIIQPIVGTISDRLRTRWGRRRPFLLTMIPISALFMLATPLAAHLSHQWQLTAIISCIVIFTMTFNIAMDPYQALLTDITPSEQRGRVTGAWMLFGSLGQVALLLAPIPITEKFAFTAILMLVLTTLTCLNTREPQLAAEHSMPSESQSVTTASHGGILTALRGLRTLKQARLYLLMFFCYGAGTGTVVPYLTSFIKAVTHCTGDEAGKIILVLMLATAIGQLPFGLVSDKIGPKRVLVASFVMIGVAALNGLWVHTLPQVAGVLALAGLGIAAQNASAYPLLSKLVPNEEIGFYIGLQTSALSIAGPLTVSITGALINHEGYRMIFLVCAILILAGLVPLINIRQQAAPAEITERNREQGRD